MIPEVIDKVKDAFKKDKKQTNAEDDFSEITMDDIDA